MPDSAPPEHGVEEDGRDTAASPNVEEDTDCSDEDAPAMDWLAMGAYEAGWQTFAGTSIRSGAGFDRLTAVYYPATENGENTPPASNNTGFPVIFSSMLGVPLPELRRDFFVSGESRFGCCVHRPCWGR